MQAPHTAEAASLWRMACAQRKAESHVEAFATLKTLYDRYPALVHTSVLMLAAREALRCQQQQADQSGARTATSSSVAALPEPYRTLGLASTDVTLAQVKKAYHTQALLCHPDKATTQAQSGSSSSTGSNINAATSAKERFQKLGEAYRAICQEPRFCSSGSGSLGRQP